MSINPLVWILKAFLLVLKYGARVPNKVYEVISAILIIVGVLGLIRFIFL